MATRFVNVDRDTPMLLPPDLREWVPAEDMAHFVIEAVAEMNLPALKINRRGYGSEQFPSKMMLQLLIYCYANELEPAVNNIPASIGTPIDRAADKSFRFPRRQPVDFPRRQSTLESHEPKFVGG